MLKDFSGFSPLVSKVSFCKLRAAFGEVALWADSSAFIKFKILLRLATRPIVEAAVPGLALLVVDLAPNLKASNCEEIFSTLGTIRSSLFFERKTSCSVNGR